MGRLGKAPVETPGLSFCAAAGFRVVASSAPRGTGLCRASRLRGTHADSSIATRVQAVRIAIASDHAAIDLKAELREYLIGLGHEVADLGPATADRVDYPDFGYKL